MRKKIIVFVVTIIILAATLCATGCDMRGKSAYEIACDNGFVGTEAEWLNSLNGKNGNDGAGIDIYDLYDAYLLNVDQNATFEDFLRAYLTVDYYDISSAAAVGLRSAVSVYSTFESTGRQSVSGAGAGVVYKIIDDYAYIITNYHVVFYNSVYGMAKEINVYCYGLELTQYAAAATFLGGSSEKDIALLRVSKSRLKGDIVATTLGDSNDIAPGDRAVAIGNPSAGGISVTSGVVSVDSENIEMSALVGNGTVVMRVIRTDTAINSGNSGGGLYDMRGRLVGIVNAKNVADGVDNIGYAIPINVAVGIAECVLNNDAKKCRLGITVKVNDYSVVFNGDKNRSELTESIVVESIDTGALASGKLLAGDRLISARIGQESVNISRLFHLSDFLYKARLGDTIFLTIERGGQELQMELATTASSFAAV